MTKTNDFLNRWKIMWPYSTIFRCFWSLSNASVTNKWFKMYFHIQKNNCWNVNSHYLSSGQKAISFGQQRPQQTIYGWENLQFSSIFSPFWGLFNASGTQIGLKICSHIGKWSLEPGIQLTLSSIWPKKHKFWSKTNKKKRNTKKM